jgi:predicted deacylase
VYYERGARSYNGAMRIPSAVVLGLLLASSPVLAQGAFILGGVTAQPGTLAAGSLRVAPRNGDAGSEVPFSILHGTKAGPVLALIAGTHGMEYVPIVALQRLRTAIDPRTLTGTIVMVHVANMPSFLGRTIYYSPADGKNLNRVFPGKADGTLSERIAETITREVITRATHVVDLHCGDGNESLRPYVYWITSGAPEVAEGGRRLALASGFDHIVIDRGRPTDPAQSVYLSNTAILRGKPALTVESGFLAVTDEESIARIDRAVAGWLRELGMRNDGPPRSSAPIWIDRSEVLTSAATGIFTATAARGDTVAEGTLIGRVTDFHGLVLQEVRAPFAGILLYVLGTPPISKGEPVGFVGQVQR